MTTHATRFTPSTGIAFRHYGPSHWQHIDTNDGRDAQVGPLYKTKDELLADHEAYLHRAGWISDGSAPADPARVALVNLARAVANLDDWQQIPPAVIQLAHEAIALADSK
jgi:hypothetical protein